MSAYQMASYSTLELHTQSCQAYFATEYDMEEPSASLYHSPRLVPACYELSQHFGTRHRIMMLLYKLISWKDRWIDSSRFERSSSVNLNLIKNEQTLLVY